MYPLQGHTPATDENPCSRLFLFIFGVGGRKPTPLWTMFYQLLLGYLMGCFLFPWFPAHHSRVTMILFVLELEWVLSTGQDKQFAWHCSESGQRLGGYRTSAVASGLQYPLLDKIPRWELSF